MLYQNNLILSLNRESYMDILWQLFVLVSSVRWPRMYPWPVFKGGGSHLQPQNMTLNKYNGM